MSGQALLKHPKRAIVIPHPEGSREAARIANTVKDKLADEMEEMGVHGEVRVSLDGEHYEVIFRLYDAGCVSIKPGESEESVENRCGYMLHSMRSNLKERIER